MPHPQYPYSHTIIDAVCSKDLSFHDFTHILSPEVVPKDPAFWVGNKISATFPINKQNEPIIKSLGGLLHSTKFTKISLKC
jgi:hypothetical protein